jgi:RimJ/RimL family protein N-acetyltransferase
MEKMPYQPQLERTAAESMSSDWRNTLPVLAGKKVTLRELQATDASALFAMLTPEEVSRFISPPPTTVAGFERFIAWALAERAAGRYVCFAVVPHGLQTAIGLFQVRQLEPGFATAEWGFALGSAFWGTGIFMDGAEMVVNFAIQTVGVLRLEARAAVANGRGNGALRKLGAVQEGVLRRSFLKNGELLDQMLWSILGEEWRQNRTVSSQGSVH